MTALNIASHDSSSEAPREANDYRFEHLNLGLLLQDMRFSRTALAPGDRLLDTTLLNLDGQEVSLRSLAAGGPIRFGDRLDDLSRDGQFDARSEGTRGTLR